MNGELGRQKQAHFTVLFKNIPKWVSDEDGDGCISVREINTVLLDASVRGQQVGGVWQLAATMQLSCPCISFIMLLIVCVTAD
jgi:hypothetical protein